MPVGMLMAGGGLGKEQYEQVTMKMFGTMDWRDQAPDGLIVHSAGEGEQGWYVYDIWESREHFERFMNDQLMPAIGEVMGGAAPPPGAGPQFFDIEYLVRV